MTVKSIPTHAILHGGPMDGKTVAFMGCRFECRVMAQKGKILKVTDDGVDYLRPLHIRGLYEWDWDSREDGKVVGNFSHYYYRHRGRDVRCDRLGRRIGKRSKKRRGGGVSETPRDMQAVCRVATVDDHGRFEQYVVFTTPDEVNRLRAIARRRGRELYKRLVENAEAD